jgi:hypothetical protein
MTQRRSVGVAQALLHPMERGGDGVPSPGEVAYVPLLPRSPTALDSALHGDKILWPVIVASSHRGPALQGVRHRQRRLSTASHETMRTW